MKASTELQDNLVKEIKRKPNHKNIKKYCETLEESGFEKQQISKTVKETIDTYDDSTLNRFIPSEFKNKTQSRNSKIGVIKKGIKSLARDMTEPVKEITEKINQ